MVSLAERAPLLVSLVLLAALAADGSRSLEAVELFPARTHSHAGLSAAELARGEELVLEHAARLLGRGSLPAGRRLLAAKRTAASDARRLEQIVSDEAKPDAGAQANYAPLPVARSHRRAQTKPEHAATKPKRTETKPKHVAPKAKIMGENKQTEAKAKAAKKPVDPKKPVDAKAKTAKKPVDPKKPVDAKAKTAKKPVDPKNPVDEAVLAKEAKLKKLSLDARAAEGTITIAKHKEINVKAALKKEASTTPEKKKLTSAEEVQELKSKAARKAMLSTMPRTALTPNDIHGHRGYIDPSQPRRDFLLPPATTPRGYKYCTDRHKVTFTTSEAPNIPAELCGKCENGFTILPMVYLSNQLLGICYEMRGLPLWKRMLTIPKLMRNRAKTLATGSRNKAGPSMYNDRTCRYFYTTKGWKNKKDYLLEQKGKGTWANVEDPSSAFPTAHGSQCAVCSQNNDTSIGEYDDQTAYMQFLKRGRKLGYRAPDIIKRDLVAGKGWKLSMQRLTVAKFASCYTHKQSKAEITCDKITETQSCLEVNVFSTWGEYHEAVKEDSLTVLQNVTIKGFNPGKKTNIGDIRILVVEKNNPFAATRSGRTTATWVIDERHLNYGTSNHDAKFQARMKAKGKDFSPPKLGSRGHALRAARCRNVWARQALKAAEYAMDMEKSISDVHKQCDRVISESALSLQ